MRTTLYRGDMAQLVERRVRNAKARGSNPLISTTRNRGRTRGSFLFVLKVLLGLLLRQRNLNEKYLTTGKQSQDVMVSLLKNNNCDCQFDN